MFFFCASVCISGCNHFTGGFNAYFWTSNQDPGSHLYIDNNDRGVLPHFDKAPSCSDESMKQNALFVYLPSGTYDIEVRDNNGKTMYEENFTVKRSFNSTTIKSSTKWKKSGARGKNENDCLIREIYY